jgi:hypothetical protein
MEQYVGLDVSQAMTHLCMVDIKGKKLWQGKCLTTPEDIAKTIRTKAPSATVIGMESGSLSTWLYHCLKEMGLPIVCIDARHVSPGASKPATHGRFKTSHDSWVFGTRMLTLAGLTSCSKSQASTGLLFPPEAASVRPVIRPLARPPVLVQTGSNLLPLGDAGAGGRFGCSLT